MAYIIAGFIFLIGCAIALAIEFAESMLTAPRYSWRPIWVFFTFATLALVIAATHNHMPSW